MTTERSFLLDELGDPNAPKGSRLWCMWVDNEIRKTLYDNQQSSTRLHNLVSSFKRQAGWQELGFLTWELFCESRYQRTAIDIDNEAELRRHGANQHSDKGAPDDRQVLNVTDKYGNDPGYWKARITRDYPETLQGVGKGKQYRTYSAAAVALGNACRRLVDGWRFLPSLPVVTVGISPGVPNGTPGVYCQIIDSRIY